ncbi:MAG: response regulator [Lentisphaeria bacterium]|nr:response regulator [Lentisphaeria bacterium]MBR3687955.1 response regulator [Lentisphaeria bacterium]
MTNKTILIIDDEEPIRELLKLTLQSAGFDSILEASNGEDGLALATRYMPDLILLDLMLPGMDGLSVCRRLKSSPDTRMIPIIMLTAKSDESDIVVGLEMGANDYITKPFSRKVLTARIRAQFRIVEQQDQSSVLQVAGLSINKDQHRVSVSGESVSLTFSEFEILLLFAEHPGRVFTRGQIIRRIKGEDYPVTDRAVDVQIVNLRRKLGEWGAAHIETIRGIGYRLTQESMVR